MSEKIKPTHLERQAILYVRQSSTYQVTHPIVGLRLPSAQLLPAEVGTVVREAAANRG